MTTPPERALWLERTVHALVRQQFEVPAWLDDALGSVRFVETAALSRHGLAPGLHLPMDVAWDEMNGKRYDLVNGRAFPFLDLQPPPSEDWLVESGLPGAPWYRRGDALVPSWNLVGALSVLLSTAVVRPGAGLDVHGREIPAETRVRRAGVAETPLLNGYIAALVSALAFVFQGERDAAALRQLVRAPAVYLSHDCDNLRGNSVWQLPARMKRAARAAAQHDFDWARVGAVAQSTFHPRRFFADDIPGYAGAETAVGYTSAFYFITDWHGRRGARSPRRVVRRAIAAVPATHEVGLHYGYTTLGRPDRLRSELQELERLSARTVHSGRAHYLRFDPSRSFEDCASVGIRLDESVGFPDRPGFRVGLGGWYQPFDVEAGRALQIIERPMFLMDVAVAGAESAVASLTEALQDLSSVGGGLSVLFHTGNLHNPEVAELRGVYPQLLDLLRVHHVVQRPDVELMEQALGLAR